MELSPLSRALWSCRFRRSDYDDALVEDHESGFWHGGTHDEQAAVEDDCTTNPRGLLLAQTERCVRRSRTLPRHMRSHDPFPFRSSFQVSHTSLVIPLKTAPKTFACRSPTRMRSMFHLPTIHHPLCLVCPRTTLLDRQALLSTTPILYPLCRTLDRQGHLNLQCLDTERRRTLCILRTASTGNHSPTCIGHPVPLCLQQHRCHHKSLCHPPTAYHRPR